MKHILVLLLLLGFSVVGLAQENRVKFADGLELAIASDYDKKR